MWRMRRIVSSTRMVWFVLVSMLVGSSMVWAVDYDVNVPGETPGGIIRAGDRQFIRERSIVVGAIVDGEQYVLLLGKAKGTTIRQGGSQSVWSNGIAEGTIIEQGGTQELKHGSKAEVTTINGGAQNLNGDGAAEETIINGGEQNLGGESEAKGTTILQDGTQELHDSSKAEETTINSGRQDLYDNSEAEETIIENYGVQRLNGESKAKGTTINGGEQYLNDNSEAERTIIEQGGTQHLGDKSVARVTSIKRDGAQYLNNYSIAKETDNAGTVLITRWHSTGTNAIENYTGHLGSVLEMEVEGSIGLAGRTFLRNDAKIKLSTRSSELIMNDVDGSNGGIIELIVASNLLEGGLVIVKGVIRGAIKLAITLSGETMNVVEDPLQPNMPVAVGAVTYRGGGSVFNGYTANAEDERNYEVVRRRHVVRLESTARVEGEVILAPTCHLPPGYLFGQDAEGYYLAASMPKQEEEEELDSQPYRRLSSNLLNLLKQCCCCFRRCATLDKYKKD